MFTDDTPDTITIQGGSNKNSNPKDIPKAIRSLGNLCRSHGVNQVLISSLMPGTNFHLNNKVKRINFLLTMICQEDGFIFINNDNILTEYLWKDGLPTFLIVGNPH